MNYLSDPAEFPFIAYYTINTTQTDPSKFYSSVRDASLSKFEPKSMRYTAAHTLDIYSEVASICRPPLMLAPNEQANVKKTPSTAYIISVYKVRHEWKHTENWTIWIFHRYLKVMTVRDLKGTGFTGLVCNFFLIFKLLDNFLFLSN